MLPHPGAVAAALFAELSARAEALLTAARRVHEREGGEAIHDLRVADRRLAATLSLWRAALDPAPARRARRELTRLRRDLGDAREDEVHLGMLTDLAREAPALAPLLGRLASRVARGRRRAAKAARPRRIARILRPVERAGAGLAGRVAGTPGLVPHTAGRAARRLAEARAALAYAARDRGDVALHAARVAGKKARYAIECLAAVGVREDEVALRELRRAQRELGTAHDWTTLLAWLERMREKTARAAVSEAAMEFPGDDELAGIDAAIALARARLEDARAAFRPSSAEAGRPRAQA